MHDFPLALKVAKKGQDLTNSCLIIVIRQKGLLTSLKIYNHFNSFKYNLFISFMQAIFKYNLDKQEKESINSFCDSCEYCSIEQMIGWTDFFYKARICYFYLLDDSGIKSFCQINESFKSAKYITGLFAMTENLLYYL
jgi:hypothetical protein